MICSLRITTLVATLVAGAMAFSTGPASALSAKECSAKYNAAKADGTLAGMKWNEFRKANCSDAADAPAKPNVAKKSDAKSSAAATVSGAVFPKAVDPKYAKETPGKARMHTCLDQYHANKATNSNGGLKWIQKGGGYYSLCNKALKG